MKKIIVVLFIISLFILSACTKIDENAPIVDAHIDYEGEWRNLVEDGKFMFTVIRGEDAPPDETSAFIKLRKELAAKTGLDVTMTTDWVKKDEEVPKDTYEILVGTTNRDESIAAYNKLGIKDFLIGFYGNRIVITAGEPDIVMEAVDFFIAQFCSDTNISVPKENYEYIKKYNYKIKE
ncbi:MAG: hypothetical protein FWF15_02335, partial [Oscillospiraceae bacterium]|nr:hypothetical protein [Oscillospiraceae bacterium]